MKVLLISGTSSYMKGGIPVATASLMNALATAGHEPGLLADVPLKSAEGFPFFHLDYPQSDAMAVQMKEAVEKFEPDLCHVVSAGATMVDAFANVIGDQPWVLTVHSIPPAERKFNRFHGNNTLHYLARNFRYLPNTILWKRMFRRGRFTKAIVHSQFVLKTAVNYGCEARKLVELPLSVDLPTGTESRTVKPLSLEDGPKIVTVGGIAHTKGTHDFLRAMPGILKEFPNAKYQIIGEVRDKDYLAMLEKLIQQLQLVNAVTIIRSAPADVKANALDEADLYVQPSHEEGFCLAYIEAAPIVPRLLGADTGAIAAISAGLPASKVFKPMDVPGLESAAKELLTQPVPADLFARRAELLKSRYSASGYAQCHLDLYQQLAKLP